MTTTSESAAAIRDRRKRLILLLACIGQFMVVLDIAIVTVALPAMKHSLDFSPTGLQWVVNAYTLTYAGFLLLGGRTAEELVFHEPTTGAANDIEKATSIARNMITQYGMSEKLGARKFGQENGEVFLGRDMGHQRDYSEEIASTIDDEVRRLIESSHDEAWEILVEYRDVLDDLVLELMEKETLQKDQVLRIFAQVQKRPQRG